ncbi:MAG: RagB/SusD family nutrient uptake outer membrane protein [Prolixibacteraceae bacterium]
MKQTYILLAAFLLFSCSDYLKEEPETILSPNNFFTSVDDLTLATHSLYAVYRIGYGDSSDEVFLTIGSDDVNSDRFVWDWGQSDVFSQSDGISRLRDAWRIPYWGITRANFIIENYETVPVNSAAEEQLRDNCAGQAYFQRGHWLFWLAKFWGPVPMPLDNSGVALPKSSVEELFKQAIADLQMAETLLPEEQTESVWLTDNGFSMVPHKGTAKAWLAQIYLQSAGWPLKWAENYAKAAQKAKEVIDNRNKYKFGLLPLETLWQGKDVWDEECVWGIPYLGKGNNDNYTMRCPMSQTPEEEGGWACELADIYFFEHFPKGGRFDVTFQTTIWIKDSPSDTELAAYGDESNWPTQNADYTWSNFTQEQLKAGERFYCKRANGTKSWRRQVSWDDPRTYRRHPYYAKRRFDNTLRQHDWNSRAIDSDEWFSGQTQRWMRFSEVLLIYAEAKAMSDGPDASAYAAFNEVRRRGKDLPDLTQGLTAEQFQDSCFYERGIEFCGLEYGTRWADLLRFEKVEQMNANRLSGENWSDTGKPKENALDHPLSKSDYYFKIPADEQAKGGWSSNDAKTDPIYPVK